MTAKMITFIAAFAVSIYAQGNSPDSLTPGLNNFHVVDSGKVYRSGQLPDWSLESVVHEFGIRSVINLRGSNPTASWYKKQMQVIQRNGLQQVDISMSAKKIPSRENLIKLLDAFRDLPRPILIHCRAGADRTGEASAIYQMIYMEKSRAEAEKMLCLQYGHLKVFAPAKDYFIRSVWQGENWARTSYEPCQGIYHYYDTHASECQN